MDRAPVWPRAGPACRRLAAARGGIACRSWAASAHRRTIRGIFGARQRTSRRGRLACAGPPACGVAGAGVRRRAHRRGPATRPGARRAHRRHRRGTPPADREVTSVSSPARGLQLTVRGWLFLVLLTMGLVMLAGTATGAVLLNRMD